MTTMAEGHAPHPYIGGRTAALRALAAWRMEWPGTPRVVVLTGDPGCGASRLLTGFLMLCEPEFRSRLPLDDMDPATVPPELPAPAVAGPAGLTAAQTLWTLADQLELSASTTADVFAGIASLGHTVAIAVTDVDRAGPVPAANEPARLVREVLAPLAAIESVRLLVEAPRALVADLAEGLPSGSVQIIDLDAREWADAEALTRQAETALNPQFGAPELPFTTDAAVRRSLAEVLAERAGTSALTVELTARSILLAPEGVDPTDHERLPTSVGAALDAHARRLGAEPQTLRTLLAPLALAQNGDVSAELWARLVHAVAQRDVSADLADGLLLVAPFVQAVGDDKDIESGGPVSLRLLHPAIGAEVLAGLQNVRAAQSRIAMSLLESVPGQDWSKAAPYVRDHIAGHTLAAGLLPQLLTDPGLFVFANPVALRAAVEAVPVEELGTPARTYLRTAPLLTRIQASTELRAALLEAAFVEDGLDEYAEAVRQLGLTLPWQTLWSAKVAGVTTVSVGRVRIDEQSDERTQVAVLVVGDERRDQQSTLLVRDLVRPSGSLENVDPAKVLRPSEEERESAPLAVSRGGDYLRVWDRADGEIVAALVSDTPVTAVDLSPDGVLVVATARGVTARRITHRGSGLAS
ncbi:ATP-binding protein [Streptomyces sp. B-S-A8]|uniref:ATP-binding protein n=1 Tax=Streptomyces solicavernae TaxID=3043614 RepID=A0ABT6S1D8_9ACTN|nr:ATP-binding protein [Streptomyces sp. B-S-A8]MDI3390512.1 ATP-binding protein [Streptomyces sp. B-S-A8]